MASSAAHSSSLTANGGTPASSHLLNNQQNKNLAMKLGRVCLGCSPAYCSNRGECSIQPNGEKQCKCRGRQRSDSLIFMQIEPDSVTAFGQSGVCAIRRSRR